MEARNSGKENALWLCQNADNEIEMQNEHTQNMKDAHTQNKVENKQKKTGKSELQDFMNSVVTKKQNKPLQENKDELQKQVLTKENVVKSML